MAYETSIRRGYFIFFAVIIVLAIIELSISAWLTARYESHHNYLSIAERDRVHFLLFCSIWTTLLSPVFPILLFIGSLEILLSFAAHVIFLSLSWVLWLSGAAAITDSLRGGLDCKYVAAAYIQSRWHSYRTQSLPFVYCTQLNALEAFAWIEWVVLTVGFIFILVVTVRALQRGEGWFGLPVSTL
ncbi:hypothetical protein BC826DRAFT_29965 [Russula brevipes]|nr:hypothetical protein BC826DRAFT_29965 [Russula brevipes]